MISRNIPSNTVKIKVMDKPWFNTDIKREIRIRDRLHKLARQKKTENSIRKFKSQRNKVNNMIKYAREQFYLSANEMVDNLSKNDSKSYWSLVRRLLNGNKNINSIPPLYDENSGEFIYNDEEKANLLNKYFCSITSLDDMGREPPDIDERKNSVLSNIEINVEEVKDILSILKIGKACGDYASDAESHIKHHLCPFMYSV